MMGDAGRAQSLNVTDWRAAEGKVNAVEIPRMAEVERRAARQAAADLLLEATRAMESGVWRVDAQIDARVMPPFSTHTWGGWHHAGAITGLISGVSFDLTQENGTGGTRKIEVNNHVWASTDGGKTWTTGKGNAPFPFFEYSVMGLPLPIPIAGRQFEAAGNEQHVDGTWAHIRAIGSPEPLDYWILLDGQGKAAGVRRITSYSSDPFMDTTRGQREFFYTVDITRAKEAIAPPVAGK